MQSDNGRKYLTWAWVSGVLVTIVLALLGSGISDLKGDIRDMQQDRVTRSEFNALSANVDHILQLMLEDRRGR